MKIRFLSWVSLVSLIVNAPAEITGWLNWRGPHHNGTSAETNLPSSWAPGADNQLWKYPLRGAGAPVIANGKLYIFAYDQFGDDPAQDVRETLVCLDANTGEKIWEERFNDFLSDTIYSRYGIGSPIIDSETGNVYLQTTNGRCVAFTADGKSLWETSLMENFGRLTFPNGRVGSPAIDGPLVIFHAVTANWGTEGPAQDRFYAFDKITGELVWSSSPGVTPVDSSFAMPVFADLGNQRVFYAGTGCGHVVCINARTGEPVWRFLLSKGGVNAQVVLPANDRLIAIHGTENTDASTQGRLVSLKIPTEYPAEFLTLDKSAEAWRNDNLINFTSSPILVDDHLYLTNFSGDLIAVQASTGEILWKDKQSPDQVHASPTFGDGKIYAPWFEGSLYIVKPSAEKAEILSSTEVKTATGAGVNCLAPPAIWGGKVYLATRDGLYCFGNKDGKFTQNSPPVKPEQPLGAITRLQIVPAEFAITPGQTQTFTVWGLDASNRRVQKISEDLSWEKFIPPTARVQSEVDATLDPKTGTLTTTPDSKISAGALKVTHQGLSATARGRVIAGLGYSENFDGFELNLESDNGEKVAFPPLPWLGARLKWHVIEKDGSQVLTNRLDNVLFQRTTNFFGDYHLSNYLLEADVMTDGNRRIKSTVGLVNQRYLITLSGNQNLLEVSSNHERLKVSVPFTVQANTWYHLKTHVISNPDGTGEVRAKAWTRGEDEPADWTLTAPVKHVHAQGAPAVYAFSPQSLQRVYIDNLKLSAAQ